MHDENDWLCPFGYLCEAEIKLEAQAFSTQ